MSVLILQERTQNMKNNRAPFFVVVVAVAGTLNFSAYSAYSPAYSMDGGWLGKENIKLAIGIVGGVCVGIAGSVLYQMSINCNKAVKIDDKGIMLSNSVLRTRDNKALTNIKALVPANGLAMIDVLEVMFDINSLHCRLRESFAGKDVLVKQFCSDVQEYLSEKNKQDKKKGTITAITCQDKAYCFRQNIKDDFSLSKPVPISVLIHVAVQKDIAWIQKMRTNTMAEE
jgi:hypothetical protein